MATKPGIYLRGGEKETFLEPGNEIGEREIVYATDTGELGTYKGWFDPFAPAKGGMGKLSHQVDSEGREFGSTWADGKLWDPIAINAGSYVDLRWRVPMRNDASGWGGGYIWIDYCFDYGKPRNVAKFDGSSYIQLEDSGTLAQYFDMDQNPSFTIYAVFKIDEYVTWPRIVNIAGCAALRLWDNTGKLSFVNGPLVGDGGRKNVISAETEYNVVEGRWYEVCITRDNGVYRMWINGIEHRVTVEDADPSSAENREDCFIGKSEYDADDLFKGEIAKIELYSSALDEDDVKKLFLNNDPGTEPLNNPSLISKYMLISTPYDEMDRHNGSWIGNEQYVERTESWMFAGHSGHDGPMVNGGDLITSMNGQYTFINTPLHDFNVCFKFMHRSYDGTLHINEDHQLEGAYGDTGMFYTNIQVTEFLQ